MLERDIERRVKSECRRLQLICVKLWAVGQVGIPDRLLLGPGAQVMFLELKRFTGKPSKRQAYWHDKLKRYGFTIEVPQGLEDAVASVRAFAARAKRSSTLAS